VDGGDARVTELHAALAMFEEVAARWFEVGGRR
jgi:hypothetical protein